jgi:archaellum component FlaC
MNAKSNQIENELNQTTKRLDELTEMRDGINNNLQTLQSGFVDGKASLDNLQTEQSKLAALDSSIKVLEVKQSELQTALKYDQDAETVKTLLGNLKTIAEQSDAAFIEYDDLRVKLGETIAAAVEKIISKSAEFYGKQREFRAAGNQIEAKEPGFNIAGELSRLGLPGKSYNSATTEFIHLSPCKFGECVALAERLVGQEIQRRQQATEQAAFAAEQAETQAAQKAKRDEEKAILSREFEAERQRVIQFRIDNGLPALLPESLDNAVKEVQTRKADARLRGATV